jgi:hypothetical protein
MVGKRTHPQDLPLATVELPGAIKLSGNSSDVLRGDGTWGPGGGGGGGGGGVFDYGLVTEGVTTSLDYGLITAGVTTSYDYGTIP